MIGRRLAAMLLSQQAKDALCLVNKVLLHGNRFLCPVCGSRSRRYFKLLKVHEARLEIGGRLYTQADFETLNVDDHLCPVCRSSDRERLIALHLKESGIFWDRRLLLHIAPERALARKIRRHKKGRYLTADLSRNEVDLRLDITRMPHIASDSMGAVICSHVLEHVADDRKALSELYRVVAPGGWALLMAPLLVDLQATHEDPLVTDPAERRRQFGQHDHLRVYAKRDFLERVEAAGFVVHQLGVDHFGQEAFKAAAITPQSVLYLAQKPLNRQQAGLDQASGAAFAALVRTAQTVRQSPAGQVASP